MEVWHSARVFTSSWLVPDYIIKVLPGSAIYSQTDLIPSGKDSPLKSCVTSTRNKNKEARHLHEKHSFSFIPFLWCQFLQLEDEVKWFSVVRRNLTKVVVGVNWVFFHSWRKSEDLAALRNLLPGLLPVTEMTLCSDLLAPYVMEIKAGTNPSR